LIHRVDWIVIDDVDRWWQIKTSNDRTPQSLFSSFFSYTQSAPAPTVYMYTLIRYIYIVLDLV
jgi:hypothetical protein